jgi:hypothetical protein
LKLGELIKFLILDLILIMKSAKTRIELGT